MIIVKNYEPMAHSAIAEDPSMEVQRRPRDPQSHAAQMGRKLRRYVKNPKNPAPFVSGDEAHLPNRPFPNHQQPPQQMQPQQIQRGFTNPFRESWGELLKESMCKGKDCKGCRGCKSCDNCKGSTCEKMGCA